MSGNSPSQLSRKLIRYGILLFLFGIITGFIIPGTQNPRMALSSHLEAVMNGMFLVFLGLIWPKLTLSAGALKWAYGLALFGTYTNWVTTLLAASWGAGAEMMPIAGGEFSGAAWQEIFIKIGLISLSVAMVVVSGILLWGLRGKTEQV